MVAASTHRASLECAPELAAIEHALDAARAGNGSLVLVEGGPGMGKSLLLAQARAAARARGMRALCARGHPLERDFPFAVAVQLFDPFVRATADGAEQAFAGAARLARPALGLEAVDAPPNEDNFEALRGLYALSANLARDIPLTLLIDDLHWVDVASARWIDHLVRRLEGLMLTVIAATGADGGATARRVSGNVLFERATTLIRLTAWTHARSARWLQECPPRAAEAVRRVGHPLTQGNPLLLRAVAAAIEAEALADPEPDDDAIRTICKRAIARLGIARLDRLPDQAIRLAQAIAVLGGGVTLRRAAALAEISADEAACLTALLADDGILARGALLEFAHPLSRDTVYDAMSRADRLVQHARATAILVADASPPQSVAEHVLCSEVGAIAQAVELLRAAARDVLGDGAPDRAARYLRRALEEPRAIEVRPYLVREFGMALLLSLDPDAFTVLRAALELLDDPQARAACALDLARGLGALGRPREAVEACLLVVDEEVPDDLAGQIEAELAACASLTAETIVLFEPYREHVQRRSATRPALRAAALALHATALARRSAEPADGVLAELQDALDAGLCDGPSTMSRWLALESLVVSDAQIDTLAVIDRTLEACQARGDKPAIASLLTLQACVHLRAGRLPDAQRTAQEAVDMRCPHGVGPRMGWAAGVLGDVLLQTGRVAEAAAVIERALSGSAPARDLRTAQLLERRARVRACASDLEAAVADATRAGALLTGIGVANPALCAWRSCAAMFLDALGRDAEARLLVNAELELARRFGRPRAIGVALHRSGLLGRFGDEVALRQSVATLESAPAPLEFAAALLDLGAALRRAGKRVDARAPLRRALDIAGGLGATVTADRARDELVASGARPRRDQLTGPASLTASELRVATLAAQGLTNRQIADELYVTRRTVEVHLTRSYQKLGIASRSQLADRLGGPKSGGSEEKPI